MWTLCYVQIYQSDIFIYITLHFYFKKGMLSVLVVSYKIFKFNAIEMVRLYFQKIDIMTMTYTKKQKKKLMVSHFSIINDNKVYILQWKMLVKIVIFHILVWVPNKCHILKNKQKGVSTMSTRSKGVLSWFASISYTMATWNKSQR